MPRTFLALTVICAAALSPWLSHGAVAQPAELPRALRSALDAAFPGWQLATTAGQRDASQWVTGDFDGDRRTDYAVQIVRPAAGAAERPQAVVAALARSAGAGQFQIVLVREGLINDFTSLAPAPRGERVRDLDADPNGERTYVLARDGFHVLFAERAAETCEWTPPQREMPFLCRISGD